MTSSILIVDDDKVTLELLREVFEKEKYVVTTCTSAEEATQLVQSRFFPVVLSDIRLLGMDGIGLLENVKKMSPSSLVILMTGFGNLDGAVRAIQEGAYDYLSKPFRIQEIKDIVHKAMKQSSLYSFVASDDAPDSLPNKAMIGKSPMIVEVYKNLARAALSNSSVLIAGESGTGKELVARAIHENSARKQSKFYAVNCGSLTESLLESELFGYTKGAFTGAHVDKKGLLEEADGGTLFLDEIGDISPVLQVKLLRVLQEGEFKPVGSSDSRKTDLRIISATHRDLAEMTRQGKFREDLYYRLKVIEICLPALRDRMEDLLELVAYFLRKYAEKNKKKISHISPEAMELLFQYKWPGNIRELEHSIERAIVMCKGSVLFPEDFANLQTKMETSTAVLNMEKRSIGGRSLEDVEKEHILKVLREANFNKSKASYFLGIDRATLYRKAQRYQINLNKPQA